MNKNGLCEHINNITKEEWEKSEFIKGVEKYITKKDEYVYDVLCFSCNEQFGTYDKLKSHFTSKNIIFISI